MTTLPRTGLQLRSTVKKEGVLELSLADVPIPEPKPDEVVVRVEASPINPSDLALLFGGADMSTANASGARDRPVVTASIGPASAGAGGKGPPPLPGGPTGGAPWGERAGAGGGAGLCRSAMGISSARPWLFRGAIETPSAPLAWL